jgi:hypothetical protein
MMDKSSYAFIWEIGKDLFALYIIYQAGDWFGISVYGTLPLYAIVIYLIGSAAYAAWFAIKGKTADILFR